METLGKHFKTLTKAAFAKHGFAQADLLSQWALIAGDDIARQCKPEKIKWPRTTDEGRKNGGTLVIRAAPGYSLDLHYQSPRLINRINQYLGHEAVVSIKVMAGVTPTPALPEKPQATDPATILPHLSTIDDPELRSALARLGAGIAPSPQPK